MASIISAGTTSGTALNMTADTSGILQLQTAGVSALQIDASQNITTTNKLAVASMPTGSIVQVVQGVVTGTAGTPYFSTTSGSHANTGLAATITPTSSSNKILVLVSANTWILRNGTVDSGGGIGLARGATGIAQSGPAAVYMYAAGATTQTNGTYSALNYLDSPATTSATTYNFTMCAYTNNGGSTVYLNYNYSVAATSTITLIEVKA